MTNRNTLTRSNHNMYGNYKVSKSALNEFPKQFFQQKKLVRMSCLASKSHLEKLLFDIILLSELSNTFFVNTSEVIVLRVATRRRCLSFFLNFYHLKKNDLSSTIFELIFLNF